MAELSEIRRAARDAMARGEPLWLATVMRVSGSAYRHAGARLLFTRGRALAGSVSGGCLEASIVRKGPWLTREHPACVYFDGNREQDDDTMPVGTGCDGSVNILIERVLMAAENDPLSFIDECLAAERRGALVTVFESSDPSLPIGSRLMILEGGSRRSTFANGALEAELGRAAERALGEPKALCHAIRGAGFEALLEIIQPPPHLFVFGTGPDATPVVEFARALGLGVTVCDSTGRISARERFSSLAEVHTGSVLSVLPKLEARRTPVAVVMSHHYPTDAKVLEMLLRSRAAYIGMLGPVRRTARILGEICGPESALSADDRARLRAPIGLDLGAETPTQIALSILSEIQAVLMQASAKPLSRRGPRPIHSTDASMTLEATTPWARTGST
jgi:xanthine dehydrogenase accessory factor